MKDLRNLCEKIKIVLPRVTGGFERFYEVPPVLQIEPANYCNVDCICCPSSRSSRPKGFMDIDLFRRIIDEASRIGVKTVFLFLHGEPMLHPRIVEMIRYVKSKGLPLHLTTNGIALNEKKIRGILGSGADSADHLTFSILGASKEVHERIVRRGNYNRTVKNVSLLLGLRKSLRLNGPVIEVVFYTMAENENEEGEFVKKWRGFVDHVRMSGDTSQSFAGYKRDEASLVVRTATCLNLRQKKTIFWNGDVTMYCQDVDGGWILGNLNERSISGIWNSSKLLAIKTIHRERQFEKIPLCHTCDM